jgi:hypothetical protein
MYMCMYVCMYVYVYVCVYICVCVDIHVTKDVTVKIKCYQPPSKYMCMYMHICVYIYIYMYVCMCVSIYLCIYMCIYIYVYIYVFIHMQIIQLHKNQIIVKHIFQRLESYDTLYSAYTCIDTHMQTIMCASTYRNACINKGVIFVCLHS